MGEGGERGKSERERRAFREAPVSFIAPRAQEASEATKQAQRTGGRLSAKRVRVISGPLSAAKLGALLVPLLWRTCESLAKIWRVAS